MGWGYVYRFRSTKEAFLHPVVQYGDAIIGSVDDLPLLYRWFEWGRLLQFVGLPHIAIMDRMDGLNTAIEKRGMQMRSAPDIHAGLERLAEDPPMDAESVFAAVARDRIVTDKEHYGMTVTEAAAAVAQEKLEKRERKARTPKDRSPVATTIRSMAPTSRIRFMKNEEGVVYGLDNCPYRAGTKRQTVFNTLKDGMTIKEAGDLGIRSDFLKFYTDDGTIYVEPLTRGEEAELENSETKELDPSDDNDA